MQGIIFVSFGTTHDEARVRDIFSIHSEIRTTYPDYYYDFCFTSRIIRHRLATRGIVISSVEEALERARDAGVTELVICCALLLPGEEYEKLHAILAVHKSEFSSLKLSRPLLSKAEDLDFAAQTLSTIFPQVPGQALVFMGHGSVTKSNSLYTDLQVRFHKMGRNDIFIGTVEAAPTIEDLMSELKEAGYQKALLAPLMQVAGDHAHNDMAVDWAGALDSVGIRSDSVLRGLGSFKQFAARYVSLIESAEEV